MKPKTHTITCTIEVTHIVNGLSPEFIKDEYPRVITEKLKEQVGFDNIKISKVKVFENG